MSKRRIKLITVILTVSALLFLCAFQTFRNETGEGGANTVSVKTPIDSKRGGTIWTRSFSSNGGTAYNSDTIVTDTCLYVASKNQLYKLNLSGDIQAQCILSASINSTCHLLLQDTSLFIPLNGGKVDCVDTDTMTVRWTSEAFGGQSLSTLFYHEGYLYGGTTNNVKNTSSGTPKYSSTGKFYCLAVSDGSTLWTYEDTENPGGYYWSGAIAYKNALYFSGDNGILVSHSLTADEVYDTYSLTGTPNIRSGITYDSVNDALYTCSNDGTLYKISADETGKIQEVLSTQIVPEAADRSSINCTSTPTICNNRIYIGSSADSYGQLSVIRADTLDFIYSVKGNKAAEIKSSPLVSTGYSSSENNERVYVYVSFNASPGGIYFIQDDSTAVSSDFQTLYTPAKAKQFCMSSICCGTDGTLYYSNDSGTLFAVRDVDVSSDLQDEPSAVPSTTPTPATDITPAPSPTQTSSGSVQSTAVSTAKASAKKVKCPSKIKIKKKKKSIKITWHKPKKNSQTIVYYKYGSGKWHKKILSSKSSVTLKRNGKKIKVRLKSRVKVNGKWYYSDNSKTYTSK